MKCRASIRLLFCIAFLFALCIPTAADDARPSVVVPRPDPSSTAERKEAEIDEKRKSEHARDKAHGMSFSYVATLKSQKGRSFGHDKDAISVKINGEHIHEFVLHNDKTLSFVIPTSIVLDKQARDSAFLEISVHGDVQLKKFPISIIALTVRKVNFEQFRKRNERNQYSDLPPPEEDGHEKFEKESENIDNRESLDESFKATRNNHEAQTGEDSASSYKTVSDEHSQSAALMRDVNALLQKKQSASSQKAIRLLDEVAQQGNSMAMTTLAALYLSGDYVGVGRNFAAAVSRLEKAVAVGNADAQALLGFLYASGIARPLLRKDAGSAVLLWEFAAKGGSQFAKIALAYRYFTGTDLLENCEISSQLYKEVAYQVLHEGNRRSRQLSGKSEEDVIDIRPPAPQEMMALSRTRLQEDMETHFSSTQQDIVQYYRHSARRGDPIAQVVIGNFHYYGGPGIPQDLPQARELFERAARAGRMDAHAHLGFMDLRAKRNESAVKHLQKAAHAGEKMGHHGLGYAALHGIGMAKDPKLAEIHFQQAAEAKVPEAMYNLAVMYHEGRGVPRKPKEAHYYFLEAARNGHLKSRYMIGHMHSKGIHPARADCNVAVRHFKEVAERGLWNKILARGLRNYEKGDYGNALYRYLQAAHAGIEVAQYNAAFMYDHNEVSNLMAPVLSAPLDRKQIIAEALELYGMSAAQGHHEGGPLSMLRMGDLIYEEGQDFESAASSYEKAAKFQNAEAMFNLGMMHALGRGLKSDAYMAKRYFDQAKETDARAFLPATVAVFALQYSDSLKQAYQVLAGLLEKAHIQEKMSAFLEKTHVNERLSLLQRKELRDVVDAVSFDAVLVTLLLLALVVVVNARQRLAIARRGGAMDVIEDGRVPVQEVEDDVGDGAGQ